MRSSNDLIRHGMEFSRAIANHNWERADNGRGIYFPKQHAFVQGQWDTWVNGRDHQIDPNEVPVEFLNYLLKAGFKNSGGIGTWYIAPFLNNIDPASNLTAATFDSTLQEFTAYDEATRQVYTLPTDPTSGSYTNALAPAVITAASSVGTGAGVDVYGAVIISASAKEATTGKLGPASLYTAPRNLKATDKLTTEYAVNAVAA